MPTKIVCVDCGFVLEEFRELPSDYWQSELLRKFGGVGDEVAKCPRCCHVLSFAKAITIVTPARVEERK